MPFKIFNYQLFISPSYLAIWDPYLFIYVFILIEARTKTNKHLLCLLIWMHMLSCEIIYQWFTCLPALEWVKEQALKTFCNFLAPEYLSFLPINMFPVWFFPLKSIFFFPLKRKSVSCSFSSSAAQYFFWKKFKRWMLMWSVSVFLRLLTRTKCNVFAT